MTTKKPVARIIELEHESAQLRVAVRHRDERIQDLTTMRESSIMDSVANRDRALRAEKALEESRKHFGELKDLLLEQQIERARLEGYRDRVHEQDRQVKDRARPVVMGMDLAGGPDRSAYWRPDMGDEARPIARRWINW